MATKGCERETEGYVEESQAEAAAAAPLLDAKGNPNPGFTDEEWEWLCRKEREEILARPTHRKRRHGGADPCARVADSQKKCQ